jgi:hypothetical protein
MRFSDSRVLYVRYAFLRLRGIQSDLTFLRIFWQHLRSSEIFSASRKKKNSSLGKCGGLQNLINLVDLIDLERSMVSFGLSSDIALKQLASFLCWVLDLKFFTVLEMKTFIHRALRDFSETDQEILYRIINSLHT